MFFSSFLRENELGMLLERYPQIKPLPLVPRLVFGGCGPSIFHKGLVGPLQRLIGPLQGRASCP